VPGVLLGWCRGALNTLAGLECLVRWSVAGFAWCIVVKRKRELGPTVEVG
jgi:hypothetical protein